MSAAKKAVRTRQARQAFVSKYGQTAFDVIKAIRCGSDDGDICYFNLITGTELAAYKANLTRGTYNLALRNCNI